MQAQVRWLICKRRIEGGINVSAPDVSRTWQVCIRCKSNSMHNDAPIYIYIHTYILCVCVCVTVTMRLYIYNVYVCVCVCV